MWSLTSASFLPSAIFTSLLAVTSCVSIPSQSQHEEVVTDVSVLKRAGGSPIVTTHDGRYEGSYNSAYNQDFFLGIPYAIPPLGERRFRPSELHGKFKGVKSARNYSPECFGYGSDDFPYPNSEDCLSLNVVRPSNPKYYKGGEKLPIGVWIHGGGYTQGGSVDHRFNLSFIVRNGEQIGKPFIGMSINYRLSFWGFPVSDEVLKDGDANLGLRDQQTALKWIQQNAATFGGDPSKVTIWGESAGASSVGFHLTAYGGKNQNLFRGAIMESGNPVYYQKYNTAAGKRSSFAAIAHKAGCKGKHANIHCLRKVPASRLNDAINSTDINWGPVIDGGFIKEKTSKQLKAGAFIKVPIISGANSDEGTSFAPRGIETSRQFATYVGANLGKRLIGPIVKAYPDNPCVGIPANLGCKKPGPKYGFEWRRVAAFQGDLVFIANRRLTCKTWAEAGVTAYCYRFDVVPAGHPPEIGANHFSEVAFVFDDTSGDGYYEPISENPFKGKGQKFYQVAKLMSRSWASFIHDQDPNSYRSGGAGSLLGAVEGSVNISVGIEERAGFDQGIPLWGRYNPNNPTDFLFLPGAKSHNEPDNYRAKGMDLINADNARYGR